MELKLKEKSLRLKPETNFDANSPEHKKMKQHWTSTELLHLRSLWWMTQRPKKVILDPHPIWFEEDLRWTRKRQHLARLHQGRDGLLIHLYCKTEAHLSIDMREGHIYRVDEQTDTLTEDQVLRHWQQFDASDRKEIQQFVTEKVFEKIKLEEIPKDATVVDCT